MTISLVQAVSEKELLYQVTPGDWCCRLVLPTGAADWCCRLVLLTGGWVGDHNTTAVREIGLISLTQPKYSDHSSLPSPVINNNRSLEKA